MAEATRAWLACDETAAAMLSRAQRVRPLLALPPPLHRAPVRAGNVVEIVGPSPSAKSHILIQAAVSCVLPKEWKGVHLGGLERSVAFFDLDCRFDILRFGQVLRHQIASAFSEFNHRSCKGCNDCPQKNDVIDIKNFQIDTELFVACMKRFLYIRCYDSIEFLASLKTMGFRPQETQVYAGGIHFLMIDSIGAFYWVDRDCKSLILDGSQRNKITHQILMENVVLEIRKLLQVHPMLVLATKSVLFGSSTSKGGTERYAFKRSMDDKMSLYREHMPSVWQSFVTHRLHLHISDKVASEADHRNVPMYTTKWELPHIDLLDKFVIRDVGPNHFSILSSY